MIEAEQSASTALRGVRVLVVEDEPLVSLALQDTLADLGCEVVGAAGRLQPALELAQDLMFDVAVLDIDLGGKRIDPVAEAIAARGLPIVFVTGYGRDGAPKHVPAPVLEKPCEAAELQQALQMAWAGLDRERRGGRRAAARG
jgi:CheY-like chemotaxis protein